MANFLLLLTLLTLLHLASTRSLHPNNNRTTTPLPKRWFSLPQSSNTRIKTPWPKTQETNLHTIPICFHSQAHHDTLIQLLLAGIEIWKPAFAVSSLALEPACGPDIWNCLCDKATRWDAVRILDVTREDEASASASQGYEFLSEGEREEKWVEQGEGDGEDADRSLMHHGLAMVRQEERKGWSRAHDVHTMAHELGHVIGFHHEHQRPDAAPNEDGEGVVVNCALLDDADDVREMIGQKTEGVYRAGDTFERACRVLEVAERYDFSAKDAMPLPQPDAIGRQIYSTAFDWDSIMLYSSYWHETRLSSFPANARFPQGAAILKRSYRRNGGLGSIGYMEILGGGVVVDQQTRKYDFSNVHISQGDIARVAQMYPNHQQNGQQAAQGAGWEQARR